MERCLQSFGHRALTKCSPSSGRVEASARKNRRVMKSVDSHFYFTSTVRKSYEMVLLAVSQKWPILLYGPVSVGKAALINELAQQSRNQGVICALSSLVNSDVSRFSYSGSSEWTPGGVEDFDKAPSDVQSILLPLLEGASTFVTGPGEVIIFYHYEHAVADPDEVAFK